MNTQKEPSSCNYTASGHSGKSSEEKIFKHEVNREGFAMPRCCPDPEYYLHEYKAGHSDGLSPSIREYIRWNIINYTRQGKSYYESETSIAVKFRCTHNAVQKAISNSKIIVRDGHTGQRKRQWRLSIQSAQSGLLKDTNQSAQSGLSQSAQSGLSQSAQSGLSHNTPNKEIKKRDMISKPPNISSKISTPEPKKEPMSQPKSLEGIPAGMPVLPPSLPSLPPVAAKPVPDSPSKSKALVGHPGHVLSPEAKTMLLQIRTLAVGATYYGQAVQEIHSNHAGGATLENWVTRHLKDFWHWQYMAGGNGTLRYINPDKFFGWLSVKYPEQAAQAKQLTA